VSADLVAVVNTGAPPSARTTGTPTVAASSSATVCRLAATCAFTCGVI